MTRWPSTCPNPVDAPVMMHRWHNLTFLHWSFDPEIVQRLLPDGLTVETYGDRAWVGLVPFEMRVWRPPIPVVPWVGRFHETNVRTYVTGPDGSSGVWFFSLDAARLGVVVVARTTYHVPYMWSLMKVNRRGKTVEYTTRRIGPTGRGAQSRVHVIPGDRYQEDELCEFDHFLTARWQLFGYARNGLLQAYADHPRWELHRATLERCDDELVMAAGLPKPEVEPIVHYSPGVDVRIAMFKRLRDGRRLSS